MKSSTRRVVWTALLVVAMLTMGAMAVAAENTVASSIMVFEGALTPDGSGGYDGTVAMIDDGGTAYGDGVTGFTVYAKNGEYATYEDGTPYACGIVTEHDAYTTAGGWGTTYDPDCADWYNYQLRLEDGEWYLEYNGNVGNDGILTGASAAPMSGSVDWANMYALERGAGEYYADPETTADDYGYALDNTCTGVNNGVKAWDMDWSWGSEYIPLEMDGFDITVEDLTGSYCVTLTPADEPDGPFNNPDYVYTKLWTAPLGSDARWPIYSDAAGKVVWREPSNDGWLADLDPYRAKLTNVGQLGTDGDVYEAQFSPSGDYVFFQSMYTTSFLDGVNGHNMEAGLCYRYKVSDGSIETIFDISTFDPADIMALTTAERDDIGWYLTQGGSDNEVLMGYRGEPGGRFDMALFDIANQTFTDLIDTDNQAEYDGQYFGADTSKLLYWTEQYPGGDDRRVVIREGGVETELESVNATTDGLWILSSRWGNDQNQVISMRGTAGEWGGQDLVMYTNDGGWSGPVDITGDGYEPTDGGTNAGNGTGMGFVFGIRNSVAGINGLWLAREVPDEVWVDDDYSEGSCGGKAWGYDAFATIQEAVDAVKAGGTVWVAAGCYEEQVIIDGKCLTLQGAGATTTKILSPDDLPVGWMSSAMNYPIVMATNADNVVISDLTIDGALKGNANSRFQGIAYVEAGGTVQNCALVDVSDNPFSGSQHGVALYVYNRDGVERTINVWDNTFMAFQKNAMALNASGTTPMVVDVRRNTIIGAGATSVTAQNGIQVWADLGTGVIDDNYVEGIAYYRSDPGLPPYVASSILNYYADLTITNNEIVDGQACIYNYYGAGDTSGNTITVIKADVFGRGIIATDPPSEPPAPYGDVEEGLSAMSDTSLKAVDVVTVRDNIIMFSGSDNTDTVGIKAEAGNGSDDVSLTITGNAVNGFDVGVGIYDDDTTAAPGYTEVVINDNDLSGNVTGIENESTFLADGRWNYWGAEDGPGAIATGSGSKVTVDVDYDPWLGSADGMLIIIPAGTSKADIQEAIDNAPYGATIKLLAGTPCHPGDLLLGTPGITLLAEPGACITFGSPGVTVKAADVTIQGFTFVGAGASSNHAAIVVDGGADNCAILDCEIYNWQDGVKVGNDNTSFKLIGNYIHNNTFAALRVGDVVLDGVVTIEGNLFKANGAAQVVNENGSTTLNCEYNSWGSNAAPSPMAGVDADPYTFAEVFMDMAPDALASAVTVSESESFDVKLKVDANELRALDVKVEWDTDMLHLDSTTLSTAFATSTKIDQGSGADTFYWTFSLSDTLASGVQDVATLSFTAQDDDNSLDGEDGPWVQYFDISEVEAETSAGAVGGIKIFVNNAGYGTAVRDDISDVAGNDGAVTINGIANYTGFIDLQGRADDSGATVSVSELSVLKASATSVSSGAWTSAHESGELLVVGVTYDIIIDARLYLPSTINSVELTDRPLMDLVQCKLLGGDANDDDFIDIGDITLIGGNYGLPASGASNPDSDVNADSLVDILDLVLAAGNYELGQSTWTAI